MAIKRSCLLAIRKTDRQTVCKLNHRMDLAIVTVQSSSGNGSPGRTVESAFLDPVLGVSSPGTNRRYRHPLNRTWEDHVRGPRAEQFDLPPLAE